MDRISFGGFVSGAPSQNKEPVFVPYAKRAPGPGPNLRLDMAQETIFLNLYQSPFLAANRFIGKLNLTLHFMIPVFNSN